MFTNTSSIQEVDGLSFKRRWKMKKKLYVDKVSSITPEGDRVGVYVKVNSKEFLLAEMHPKKAKVIQQLWNKLEKRGVI